MRAAEVRRFIAEKHHITVEDLLGPKRNFKFVAARRELLTMLVKHFPKASCIWIAREVNRDHTTVLYHLGRLSREVPPPRHLAGAYRIRPPHRYLIPCRAVPTLDHHA